MSNMDIVSPRFDLQPRLYRPKCQVCMLLKSLFFVDLKYRILNRNEGTSVVTTALCEIV